MIVFYDTCKRIFNEKDFVKLATASRHKIVIYVQHKLFQQSKQSRTINLNTVVNFVQITTRHSTN